MNYIIGYDLNRPHQDYPALIGAIQGLGLWWHCLDSTWIVKSNLTTTQIRDQLGGHIDANDELLVVDITGKAASWKGFTKECADWLLANL